MNKELVDRAKSVIASLNQEQQQKNNKKDEKLTTSQIRKFLAGVNAIENKLQLIEGESGIRDDLLPGEIQQDIQALKVKLVYQCGRNKAVKTFEYKAGLLKEIDAIGTSAAKFRNFAGYVEALVAYHRFEGGE